MHCPLWYSLSHPAPLGLDALVQTWQRLHLYAFPPNSLGDSQQGRPTLSGASGDSAPPPRDVEALGLAPEGDQFLEAGLSSEVVETLLNAKAPFTRKLYALKWRLFSLWCAQREQDPVYCLVGTVLGFLQSRLSRGLSPSTLKVYVAAIAANHTLVLGATLGMHTLVSHFLHSARRLRPSCRPRLPSWDLSVVLYELLEAPLEPMESASKKFLTLKTALRLALASLRRVGDLQALSVAPTCLEFSPDMFKAILHPRAGYVPKVPRMAGCPIVLQRGRGCTCSAQSEPLRLMSTAPARGISPPPCLFGLGAVTR
ncbi:hypothetical protein QTP86_014357, partial [Hemibagrus guttatus]